MPDLGAGPGRVVAFVFASPEQKGYLTVAAGTYIAMNGRIWDPLKVRKNVDANRFEAIG